MLFPRCGKVLVIDDQITEAMPLLNLLGKKGVPAMYYSGNLSELPETPFDEIRLVFCDLKYNVAADAKSVASTVISILKALISEKNGPYILLAWSAHGADYLEELKITLDSTKIKPEFILQLDKSEFFSSQDNDTWFDEMIDSVSRLELDAEDEVQVKKLIEEKVNSFRSSQKIPNTDALENIEKKLAEELKKANLFHLFVLWENTIAASAIETVNSIYDAIPDSIPVNKKLRAMLFYLGQFTRNYTQTVKRAADNKRRYAPGKGHSACLLWGYPKGAAPHLAHDFAKQSVVCYTLCRRCRENAVAAGEGKGI